MNVQLGHGTTNSGELTTETTWTRLGPVFLWWSEYSDAATIGPEQGAWGGPDIWHCDVHPDWQGVEGSDEDETSHAATHGIFVRPLTGASG